MFLGEFDYGPGGEYVINTNLPFHVRTQFWTPADVGTFNFMELSRITTTLSQDGRSLELVTECPDLLTHIRDKLQNSGSLFTGLSAYSL